jgi:anti-sigma regulatory factor (Ser/Thr protein kinase)
MKEIKLEYIIEGGDFISAGRASSSLKKVLNQLNLDPSLVRRIAVSTYEAEVNVVAHAFRGVMHVSINPQRVLVRLEDEGPGIPDIEKAMQEGYSTASARVREMGFGAGMGLSNIKNNADDLVIKSEVTRGTVLEIKTYLKTQKQ